ncbi:conserved virulence factor C family protein [Sediminibacillus halophilus]|uniref:HEAT repeat-containing protein n=1 Tax=Sediminibacillus halophilus TaxID=482461 RepID=A0A1G9R2F6_9BACI|nr:conserved virulence factor C family protein [Sediminibacillus halophilus]SDM17037.1 HEAT repeat-containing protein [Sediminibacillus halophilus]
MKLVSIEPTPSPHSMKINVDEELPAGQNHNYKQGDDLLSAPDYIQALLNIEGVKGIYRVADFLALERHPKYAWETILPAARQIFGEAQEEPAESSGVGQIPEDAFGEVKVFIQQFRGLPMQVKLEEGDREQRFGLPQRFLDAAMEASTASSNMVMERKWVEQSPRYGTLEEIGETVVDEITASYDEERLKKLVKLAFQGETEMRETESAMERPNLEILDDSDWKNRYAALDKLVEPDKEDLPFLAKALKDDKASIRRLATAYLGMIEDPIVLPYLYQALQDKVVTVRRTAGDCISDLGFKQAMPQMMESLQDKNRLVRWRAAMFLYEVGDESALPALEAASDDPEFEVRMQVNLALERIKGGEEAKGSVWSQMTEATKK